MQRTNNSYEKRENIKLLFQLGVAGIILYNLQDIINKIKGTFTPTAQETQNKEIDKGKIVLTKKGTGLNLKRYDSDTYLQQRVEKLKSGIEKREQSMIQSALIPVKSDADYARMSELFGEQFSLMFLSGDIGYYNMSEAIQTFATAYTKARINQSWANNKKYPNYITFKI